MLDFVLNGRNLDEAYVGGSIPPDSDPLWNRFRNLGAQVDKQERGVTGGKVAVGEMIQLAMANRVLDQAPGTVVLLTGDGSGYSEGKGFIKALKRAHKHGWGIEVVSWDAGCNRYLRQFAEQHGTHRSLEPVYEAVTFINNWQNPLSEEQSLQVVESLRSGGKPEAAFFERAEMRPRPVRYQAARRPDI